MEEKGQIASIFEPNTWTLTYQVAKLKVKTLTKERTSQNLLWPVSIGSIGFMLKLHKLRLTEMQLTVRSRTQKKTFVAKLKLKDFWKWKKGQARNYSDLSQSTRILKKKLAKSHVSCLPQFSWT